jgi:hypothetical protein
MTYTEVTIPDRWRILGHLLTPLTLGHWALGERLDVVYFTAEKREARPADLALAILICSRPWTKARAKLQSKSRWCNLHFRFLAWCLAEPEAFETYHGKFLEYLAAQFSAPSTWTSTDDRKNQCGSPWPLSLRCRLVADFGVPWHQSLHIPIAEAHWMSAAQGEREGTVEWVTPAQQQVMAALRAAKQQTQKPAA